MIRAVAASGSCHTCTTNYGTRPRRLFGTITAPLNKYPLFVLLLIPLTVFLIVTTAFGLHKNNSVFLAAKQPSNDRRRSVTAAATAHDDRRDDDQKSSSPTRRRFLFEPGSLKNQSRAQTLSRCHVPSVEEHGKVINRGSRGGHCLYSERYGVVLTLSSKTGSGTQNYIFKRFFNATHENCPEFRERAQNDTSLRHVKFAFPSREPTDHFFSAYREMLKSKRVYTADYLRYSHRQIPRKYAGFLDVLNKNYSRPLKRKKLRVSGEEQDLRIKAAMFNAFVRDYNGIDVVDVHFGLQTPKFRLNQTHMVPPFDYALETSTLTRDLANLAATVGAPEPKETTMGSKADEPFDMGLVTNATLQKICRFRAIDYCCLNYELPPACRDVAPNEGNNGRVMCEWVVDSAQQQLQQQDYAWAIAPVLV